MLAGAAGYELINRLAGEDAKDFGVQDRIKTFFERGRLHYWGEGALSQHLVFFWLLIRDGDAVYAKRLLLDTIRLVVERQQRDSKDPLLNPYLSADECLTKMFSEVEAPAMKSAVESWNLFPLIILSARHGLRDELEALWPKITNVIMSWLIVENPVDLLQWESEEGTEHSQQFGEQSWTELLAGARRENPDRLPAILWDDHAFGVMFLLTFQHRMLTSLTKRLDEAFSPGTR